MDSKHNRFALCPSLSLRGKPVFSNVVYVSWNPLFCRITRWSFTVGRSLFWTFALRQQYRTRLLISPLPACRETLSLLAVCQSVSLSVCSVRLSVTLWFSGLFSSVFWDIDLKYGVWICHNIIRIKFEFSSRLTYFYRRFLPFAKI